MRVGGICTMLLITLSVALATQLWSPCACGYATLEASELMQMTAAAGSLPRSRTSACTRSCRPPTRTTP